MLKAYRSNTSNSGNHVLVTSLIIPRKLIIIDAIWLPVLFIFLFSEHGLVWVTDAVSG